jgi:hypothetical protein
VADRALVDAPQITSQPRSIKDFLVWPQFDLGTNANRKSLYTLSSAIRTTTNVHATPTIHPAIPVEIITVALEYPITPWMNPITNPTAAPIKPPPTAARQTISHQIRVTRGQVIANSCIVALLFVLVPLGHS